MSAAADSSAGYAGRVSEVTWAALEEFSGCAYAVANSADLKVTAAGSGDRPLTVAAGKAFGHGVYDSWTGSTVLNADLVSSGVRWDTLVITRTWGVGNRTSVLTINKGTSAQAVTITNSTPGTIDDQPIFLFKVTAGSTSISNLIDLRAFPSKIASFATKDGLPAGPRLGALAMALDTGHQWAAELVAGTPAWVDQDAPNWVTPTLTGSGGDTLLLYQITPQYGLSRGHVDFKGNVKRTTGFVIKSTYATDGSQDVTVTTLPAGFRPASSRYFLLPEAGGISFARCTVGSDGVVRLFSDGRNVNAVDLSPIHYSAEL